MSSIWVVCKLSCLIQYYEPSFSAAKLSAAFYCNVDLILQMLKMNGDILFY